MSKGCQIDNVVIPPGMQIYKDDKVSIFEVNGNQERVYCENLCLLAKLFLDHKNIRFDCSPFLFYVLVENETQKLAGYFSKEYGDNVENNLSCILVMPHCQRKGHGKFLIEFSYCLSRIEGKRGTPERPLSDLGFRSYVTYWAIQVIKFLMENPTVPKLNILAIAEATNIEENDVLYILDNFRILRKVEGSS